MTTDARTRLLEYVHDVYHDDDLHGLLRLLAEPEAAALVAEAAGAEKVWWCVSSGPADVCRDYADKRGAPFDPRCGWRWLLPATEEA